MTDTDAIVISDPQRVPITAQKREGGGVVLHGPRTWLALSATELDRIVAFVRNEARLLAYPVTTTPARARLTRVPDN